MAAAAAATTTTTATTNRNDNNSSNKNNSNDKDTKGATMFVLLYVVLCGVRKNIAAPTAAKNY